MLIEYFVYCSRNIWQGKRNAWMETTIIHKFLLPPFSPLLLANGFLRNILFTHFDLLSTDMQ